MSKKISKTLSYFLSIFSSVVVGANQSDDVLNIEDHIGNDAPKVTLMPRTLEAQPPLVQSTLRTGIWECLPLWSTDFGEGSAGESDTSHLLFFERNALNKKKIDAKSTEPIDRPALLLADETGNFYSLDPKAGQLNWVKNRNTAEGRSPVSAKICSGPIFLDDHFFLVSREGEIFCFEVGQDPKLKWEAHLDHPLENGLAVSKGRVFIQDAQQNLYALNLKDGQTLWQHSLTGSNQVTQIFFGHKATSVPLILPCGSILAFDDQGYLNLINPTTGETLDRKSLARVRQSQTSFEDSTILAQARMKQDKNFIYIPTLQGIYAIYKKDFISDKLGLNLKEVWKNSNDKIWFDIEVAKNRIYYSTLQGEVVSVNQNTGEEIWRRALVTNKTELLGSPKLVSTGSVSEQSRQLLLITDRSGYLHGLDPLTGTVVLKQNIFASKIPFNREGLYETVETDLTESNKFFVNSLSGKTLCFKLILAKEAYVIPDPFDIHYNEELYELRNELS